MSGNARMQKRSVTPAMYRDFEENHPDVYSLLRSLGVSANHTYFFYTAYAIALVASCPLRGHYFPGKVLMPVAVAYNVPTTPVQCAICSVAETAFRANTALLTEIFPCGVVSSSSQFVNTLAAYIRDKYCI